MLKYIGLVILALWLIAQGVGHLLEFYFPKEQKILPIINIVAGVILVLATIKIKRGEIGLLILGIWAVFQSSMFLFNYSFNYSNMAVHILGIFAGLLLIFKV